MTLRLTFPGVPAPQQIRLESTQSLQLIE
jgi:hypothetical protein